MAAWGINTSYPLSSLGVTVTYDNSISTGVPSGDPTMTAYENAVVSCQVTFGNFTASWVNTENVADMFVGDNRYSAFDTIGWQTTSNNITTDFTWTAGVDGFTFDKMDFNFNLSDTTQTVLSNNDMPASIDVSNFDFGHIEIGLYDTVNGYYRNIVAEGTPEAVPEPTTSGLLIISSGMIFALRRQYRKL